MSDKFFVGDVQIGNAMPLTPNKQWPHLRKSFNPMTDKCYKTKLVFKVTLRLTKNSILNNIY